MEPWAAAKRNFVSVAVPPAPVRVPSQRPLAPSFASVTSIANDKNDNEMILGAVHRSLVFALQLRKPYFFYDFYFQCFKMWIRSGLVRRIG